MNPTHRVISPHKLTGNHVVGNLNLKNAPSRFPFFQGFCAFRNSVDREKWVVETWSLNTDSCTQELRANSGVEVISKRAGT
jgi:hypothetical protein